jgi:hypothetical protein
MLQDMLCAARLERKPEMVEQILDALTDIPIEILNKVTAERVPATNAKPGIRTELRVDAAGEQ